MGKSIAFYSPLKSPNHQTPSGDRTISQGLLAAINDIKWVDGVDLASELRSRDGIGDKGGQRDLIAQGAAEVARILEQPKPWDAWVTYHNYYKAPDFLGPAICKALNIPYFIVEASRSPKRASGPWAKFSALADAASDAADAIFYFTQRDLPELEKARPKGQKLVHMPPFLNVAQLPEPAKLNKTNRLLAVGMLRFGDKLASYANLANALSLMPSDDWTLTVVGDGKAQQEVTDLFAPFHPRVRFCGGLSPEEVQGEMMKADVFVWPGVNEAFGMVYLEAQAVGLPVVAEDRPGVRDVIGPHSVLVPRDNPEAFARAVKGALTQDWAPEKARSTVRERHLRPAATATLAKAIGAELEV